MAYPPISALPSPPSRQDPANFADEADAFLGALPTFQTETNTAGTYIEGKAAEAETSATNAATSATGAATSATEAANSATAAANSAASAGGVLWVSGTTYAVGYVVYSPITFTNYRCIQATSGTTDPSLDEVNWTSTGGGGGGGLTEQTATTTATTETAIATYVAADYTAMELTVVADSGGERTITKLLVVHNGTTASATQYGEVSTATVLSTYDVDVSGADVRLLATPASATSTEFTTKENLFEPLT
tara:strand:+ start:56 stop:799 length:744 start_codon:yes stop_codon:yes gene_type:complete